MNILFLLLRGVDCFEFVFVPFVDTLNTSFRFDFFDVFFLFLFRLCFDRFVVITVVLAMDVTNGT